MILSFFFLEGRVLVGGTASDRLLEYFTLLRYWYSFGFLLRMMITIIIIVGIRAKISRMIMTPTTAPPAIIDNGSVGLVGSVDVVVFAMFVVGIVVVISITLGDPKNYKNLYI